MTDNLIKIIEESLFSSIGEPVQVKSWKLLGGGCINNSSKLETSIGPLFIKWNANCKSDMFLREAESLKELRKASDGTLIVPEVFCAKRIDETPGFLIQEYLPPGYSEDDDAKLGRGLATIHRYSNSHFGFYQNNYCGATEQNNNWVDNWLTFFAENRLVFLLRLIEKERPLPKAELHVYDKLITKLSGLIPNTSTPVLIHGDLWSGNFIHTENGPALIDPAAYYADREMEFAIITMFGGFSSRFFDAYNEVYPLDSDWRHRNELYQLYHVLNHYYLFGGSYQQQALSIAKQFV